MNILDEVKEIKSINNAEKRQKYGIRYLEELLSMKISFSSKEVYEIIYLCIYLFYRNGDLEDNNGNNLKIAYLNVAKKFLHKYFDTKDINDVYSNNDDVLMFIELSACFSLECFYEESTKLLIGIIENDFVDKKLKIRALEELFFESEQFLAEDLINKYKLIYKNLMNY